MCAQTRDIRGRRHHSHQAGNIASDPLEITLGRNIRAQESKFGTV